jgi:hypothetical protein
LGQGIAGSCELIAGKSAATGERFAVMGARLEGTDAKQDPTCVNFARIVATELRSRSCARTVAKSGAINVKCAATVMSFVGIDVTCVEMFATFGTTGAMRGETNREQ